MNETFLKWQHHLTALFIFGIVLKVAPLFVFALLVLLYVVLFKLFQRAKLPLVRDKFIVIAPITGVVAKIRKNINHIRWGKNLTEIRITLRWWDEYGIYAPAEGEIVGKILRKGRALFRLIENDIPNQSVFMRGDLGMQFQTPFSKMISLQFVRCLLGGKVKTWAQDGDYVYHGASLGLFLLGGTVLIYLPNDAEILIKETDQLVACDTRIAKFNNGGPYVC